MLGIVENFLTEQECKDLIALATPHLKHSSVVSVDAGGIRAERYEFRNSQDYYVRENNEIVDKIKKHINAFLGIPVENMEDMCIICYRKGEYFKAHHDFFHPNTPNYEECISRGGNRNFTCLFYLQSAKEGGNTYFPKLDREIYPKVGTLLYWQNMIGQELQYDTLHEGLPVLNGEKWIASIWCRESKFK